jgi:hypothetical protein
MTYGVEVWSKCPPLYRGGQNQKVCIRIHIPMPDWKFNQAGP